jgi:hypothetical protein
MKTTIGRLKGFNPCQPDFDDFIDKLSIIRDCKITDETEVSILEILDIAGAQAAYWSLRTQDYKDDCLILADVLKSVLYIYERKYPDDKSVRKLIQAIRDYKTGKISKEQLRMAYRATNAAYVASFTDYANYAADYAAAVNAAYAAFTTAYAAYTATNVANRVIAANVARKNQWELNEQILRKHLSATAGEGEDER